MNATSGRARAGFAPLTTQLRRQVLQAEPAAVGGAGLGAVCEALCCWKPEAMVGPYSCNSN